MVHRNVRSNPYLICVAKHLSSELLDLIPSMCSEDSFIELLHSLLDMPLISAGLETMLSNGDRRTHVIPLFHTFTDTFGASG